MRPYLIIVLFAFSACNNDSSSDKQTSDPNLLYELNHALTEAIIQDGFSPPVASRIYAYSNLTAQLAVAVCQDSTPFYVDRLNGFGTFELDQPPTDIDPDQVLSEAFVTVAKSMTYRDHILDSLMVKLENGQVTAVCRKNSSELAQRLANFVLARVNTDGYKETRMRPRYEPQLGEDRWEPTPPAYAEALEPYWNTIRPFAMDSASQFFEPLDFGYSTDKNSAFYQIIAKEVYDSVANANDHTRLIAQFWDCNPFITKKRGHLMYHVRQLTPGGHWLGITEIACKKEGLNRTQAAQVFARVAVAMADGFICAWDCKYKTNFIRPETYINRHMDTEWRPLLESPHFPEFTSAHSTISSAAAYVLTQHFGADFHYIDSTEVPFGLPPRTFNSFFEASDEASLSRIMGGIHFRPAIEVGIKQGREVGKKTLKALSEPTH